MSGTPTIPKSRLNIQAYPLYKLCSSAVLAAISVWVIGERLVMPAVGQFVLFILSVLLIWDIYIRQTEQQSGHWNSTRALERLLTLFALLAALPIVIAMLSYINPMLMADEWRHYYDYFFRYSFLDGIIARQNGHLMLLPNSVFKMNYLLGSGRQENLASVNAVMVFATGWVLGSGFIAGQNCTFTGPRRGLIRAIFILCAFSITNMASSFWGLGVHNQSGVLFAALAILPISGAFGSLSRFHNIVAFTVFAFISASSFSAAAAVWFLGPAATIVTPCRIRTVIVYCSIAILGFMITLGLNSLQGGLSNISFSITDLVQVVTAMLGLPATMGLGQYNMADKAATFRISMLFGMVGIVVLVIVTAYIFTLRFQHLSHTTKLTQALPSLRVCWLFTIFSVGACFLVAIGRISQSTDIQNFLYPRFIPWSYCLWVGSAGFGLYFAYSKLGRSRISSPAWISYAITTLIIGALAISNTIVLKNGLTYRYSHAITVAADLIVNRNEGGAVAVLWRPDKREIVQRVANDAFENRLVIFAQDWARRDETRFHVTERDAPSNCIARLTMRPYKESNDFLLDGWVHPIGSDLSTIRVLFAIDPMNQVIGIALPRFGNQNHLDVAEIKARQPIASLFSVLPGPYDRFPGISGYFRGIVSATGISVDEKGKTSNIRYYARDVNGRICKVHNL